MKIYEKPMAKIEKINVEDVITSSAEVTTPTNNLNGTIGENDTTIVFEW